MCHFSIADPPEIKIEQNWYQRDGDIEVELICIAHARPRPEVRIRVMQQFLGLFFSL